MSLWQFNAFAEAFKLRVNDQLSLQLQSAYMGAYWGAMTSKPKKSLKSVLDQLTRHENKQRVPIDVQSVSEQFKQIEEIQKYGYIKCS